MDNVRSGSAVKSSLKGPGLHVPLSAPPSGLEGTACTVPGDRLAKIGDEAALDQHEQGTGTEYGTGDEARQNV